MVFYHTIKEVALKRSLRAATIALCVLVSAAASATGQRRASSKHDLQRFRLETGVSSASPRLEPNTLALEPSDSTKSHTLLGIVVGAVAGGAIAIGANRVIHGKCDEPEDAIINCDVAHEALFVVGAVPGAIVGGIIGHQIKTKR
jgi:hypothetical protein